jgi:hypothetical protein
MGKFIQELIQPFLEENNSSKNIALIPGGFKPPTLGHFYLAKEIANRDEIDEVLILIGHKTRDGVTKEQSLKIWEMYKNYLPQKVNISISSNPSPIGDVISIIKNNPQNFYFPAVGYRGEEDKGDLSRFDSLKGKYDNYNPIIFKSDVDVSGTKIRDFLSQGNFEGFNMYLPTELSDEDRKLMWDILTSSPINENTTYSTHINYKQQIRDLTKHMLDKGMNIKPLPKVIFKHSDKENAKNFFGKTAYYNPDTMEIVLYTEGRHPKDLVRSFSHEMIHHLQNIENRLGNISTTNTMEDDNINKLEQEANLKGTMMFRNWTDSLNNNIKEKKKPKDPFGINQFIRELFEENVISEGRYDSITNKISSDILRYWKENLNDNNSQIKYQQEYNTEDVEVEIEAYLNFVEGSNKLVADGGVDDEENWIQIRFEIDPTLLPQYWEEISFNLKDVVRHEIEHLTHGEGTNLKPNKYIQDDILIRKLINSKLLPQHLYFELEKEIDANLQGMYFRAKKEKRPFKDVIETYLNAQDITPQEKEEILNIWRTRLSSLNLPKF